MSDSPAPLPALRKNFWIFTIITLLYIFFMRWMTLPLNSKAIVDFELAKTTDRAMDLMSNWLSNGLMERFRVSVYLDFLFILLYAAVFYLGCRFLARLSGNYVLRKAGQGFSWLVLVAAICDVVENLGMLFTVNRRPVGWVVHLSYDMATIKFSLLIIAALFMFICLLFWVMNRIRPEA